MKSLLPPELQPAWDVLDTKPRRERLAELAFAGYRIPRCGVFQEMFRLGVPLVVYADEYAHCAEGKVLWTPDQTVWWPWDTFCSEYVPDDADGWRFKAETDDKFPSQTYRHLFVGCVRFHLEYRSATSWMSNADGKCKVLYGPETVARDGMVLSYPMFSIDYTIHEGFVVHFDLNTCPGVPLEVVNAVGRDVLRESVAQFCRDRGLIA